MDREDVEGLQPVLTRRGEQGLRLLGGEVPHLFFVADLLDLHALGDVAGEEAVLHGLPERLAEQYEEVPHGPHREPGLQLRGPEGPDVVGGEVFEPDSTSR